MRAWLTGGVLALAFAVLIAPRIIGAAVPMSTYYELRSVTIDDTVAGVAPHIVVDRSINRPFMGRFDAIIMREQGSEFVPYWNCGSHDSPWRRYRTDAALPLGADLDWWLDIPPNRECDLPPGRYKIITTAFAQSWFGAQLSVERSSNVFTVWEPEP